MAVATYGIDYGSGGVSLKAAGLIAADTDHTAAFLGRGWHAIRIAWTAAEVASTDELYNVVFQADTKAAVATYIDLQAGVAFGDSVALGGAVDTAATGETWIAIFNPYDNNVRAQTFVAGTIATGFNCTIDAYPLNVIGAY
jgi:hypothetical protein